MAEEFIDDIIKGTTEEKSTEEITADISKTDDKVDDQTDDQKTDAIVVDAEPEQKPTEDKAKVIAKAENKNPETFAQVEELAEKLGWNKDFQGEGKVDAATYILKSREIQDTMREYNKDLKGQVSSLNDSIKMLQEHNENVFKAEVKKLEGELARLKKEKREAVELADVNKVDEIDEQIDNIQKDLNKPKTTNKPSGTSNPVYDSWIGDNQWYEQDDEMAMFADSVAEQYKGAPLERIYAAVRRKVEEVFPDKFETPKQNVETPAKETVKPVGPKSPVEGGSKRESKSEITVNDLTAEQRAIMNDFVKREIMTEKQYIADIAKMQEG